MLLESVGPNFPFRRTSEAEKLILSYILLVIIGIGFMLSPDAKVTLRDMEIHVKRTGRKPVMKKDQDCVDVLVYKLPVRAIQVRETWCPQQFLPIIL